MLFAEEPKLRIGPFKDPADEPLAGAVDFRDKVDRTALRLNGFGFIERFGQERAAGESGLRCGGGITLE